MNGGLAPASLFGLAGTLALGAPFFWALIDPDGQFLHDRLAGTGIVKDEGWVSDDPKDEG